MTRNHNTYEESYNFNVKGVEFTAPTDFKCSFCGGEVKHIMSRGMSYLQINPASCLLCQELKYVSSDLDDNLHCPLNHDPMFYYIDKEMWEEVKHLKNPFGSERIDDDLNYRYLESQERAANNDFGC